jgi:hypothetical protein
MNSFDDFDGFLMEILRVGEQDVIVFVDLFELLVSPLSLDILVIALILMSFPLFNPEKFSL